MGGGDITVNAKISEEDTAFNYSTGSGNDNIDIELDGDATDYAGSSLNVSTGAGSDNINVAFQAGADDKPDDNQQLNQTILDNVTIDGGANGDHITVNGVGNANIYGGDGNDVIITAGAPAQQTFISGDGDEVTAPADYAVWAFNFDAERVDAAGGLPGTPEGDLPGEPTSLAYIGGATVTVTLSGAGGGRNGNGGLEAGGGVMAADGFSPHGAWAGENGYESSVMIDSLLNGNEFYGDQRDINAAVMTAINSDPVLGELLEVRMGSNNTLIVESTTSGLFGQGDLRIEIEQADQDDWTDVEAEAQALFNDSSITVTDAQEANAAAGLNNFSDLGDISDFSDSDNTDSWYDGLSAEGDDGDGGQATRPNVGEREGNRLERGTASDKETDNVINGGNGDDLIVLSTDAVADGVPAFTVNGNNAMLNGASNETIVMEGANFGNDTIMNFTTSGVDGLVYEEFEVSFTLSQPVPAGQSIRFIIENLDDSDDDTGTNNDTVITVDGPLADGTALAAEVASELNAINAAEMDYDVDVNGNTLTLTAQTAGNKDDVNIPAAGSFLVDTATGAEIVALNNQGVVQSNTQQGGAPGLDFLDFTDYLTSEYDVSPGNEGTPADTDDSEVVIPVTLNHNPGGDNPAEVQANEVVTVTYVDDGGDPADFDSLSGADIAALFNNNDGSGDYDNGAFDDVNFDVSDNQSDAAVVGGNAKAVIMVENAANEGEYKVFELSWDASADDGEEGVSATEIGSLDFGDSLDGLTNVNLVGSDEHANIDLSTFL
ncbi:hypothetical protein [Roseovarius sp. A46]|uniref:hypothetical protein n=1 Tax=Roseovarius sp. A46 TaxID=2109331 RepID=UPI0019D6EF15|nr:hypothetical protein [Roseovarius sp. A46]